MHDQERRHKWWGWGPEGHQFDMASRPRFWEWIRSITPVPEKPTSPPLPRDQIHLPPRKEHPAFLADVRQHLAPDQIRDDDDDRLLHAYGRSFRDLVRLRTGLVGRAPDLVLYPAAHEEVERLVGLAVRHNVCLIPFGGGTNIVGCLEPKDSQNRVAVSLDMRRMNRLLKLDAVSQTAELEAGVFGPDLETLLQQHGFALGHYPDSFQYSTLGGWLATRSAGTQSNAYGKIEDLVVALRVVTPRGTVQTRVTPATSSGPDVNRLFTGSEGTYGIITSATMRIHPIPGYEDYRVLMFRSFLDGFAALRACQGGGCMPSMARLSDEMESELILASKPESPGWKKLLQAPVKALLKRRGYTRPALLVVAFEGPRGPTQSLRRHARRLCRRHGAFDLGAGPGQSWRRSRYDIPYLRDYLMDFGMIVDSLETATVWGNVLPLYEQFRQRLQVRVPEVTGHDSYYLGCHLSHFYPTGACLYFTFGGLARTGSSPEQLLEQYVALKGAATQAIVDAGGTLSHHHAVGLEHQPWMTREHTPAALHSLRAIKAALDPTAILNPGTLLPPADVRTEDLPFFQPLGPAPRP